MYEQELNVALLAVQRAAILTKRVFHEKAKGTVSKDGAFLSRLVANLRNPLNYPAAAKAPRIGLLISYATLESSVQNT